VKKLLLFVVSTGLVHCSHSKLQSDVDISCSSAVRKPSAALCGSQFLPADYRPPAKSLAEFDKNYPPVSPSEVLPLNDALKSEQKPSELRVNTAVRNKLESVAKAQGKTLQEYLTTPVPPSHFRTPTGSVVTKESLLQLGVLGEWPSFVILLRKIILGPSHLLQAQMESVTGAGECHFVLSPVDEDGNYVVEAVEINFKSGNYRIGEPARKREAIRAFMDALRLQGIHPKSILIRELPPPDGDGRILEIYSDERNDSI
jgi:hypothetical protein